MEMIKRFLKEEDGMTTVEIVIIVSVLVAIALLFKDTVTKFVTDTLQETFGEE